MVEEEFDQAPASGNIGTGERAWTGREEKGKAGAVAGPVAWDWPSGFDWRRVRSRMELVFPGAAVPVWNLGLSTIVARVSSF